MVWADADCACADTAIGCSPPSGAPVLRGRPPIIVGRKLAQAKSAASELFRPPARHPFGMLNDIPARAEKPSAVACRNSIFTPEEADEPRLQRHRRRWPHPGTARSLGQIHGS